MATDKKGLTIEVVTHAGAPRLVGGIWTREALVARAELRPGQATHDPYGPDHDVDNVLRAFQEEHTCKVTYLEDDTAIRRFDVFEPSWADSDTARRVGHDLLDRLVDLTCAAMSGP